MRLDNFDTKLDDGHKVEQHIYETDVDGNKERVVETNVDKTIFGVPVSFQEKVTEKTIPIVASRKRETYKDGKLVETTVEQLDASLMKMQPVQPVANLKSTSNFTVAEPVVTRSDMLTKDDLFQALKELLETIMKKDKPVDNNNQPMPLPVPINPVPTPVPVPVQSDGFEGLAWIILSGELAFCIYNLVLKNWF